MNKKRMVVFVFLVMIVLSAVSVVSLGSLDPGTSAYDDTPVVTMVTNMGTIEIELYVDDAPITVDNFIKYVEDGFYDGLIFHRVIDGFMIQGGGFEPGMEYVDPTYGPIENEAPTSRNRNLRGTIAMARTSDPHSATSQFFINHVDNDFLDWDNTADGWGYCVFGRVIQGMDVVDAIAVVPTHSTGGHNDVPTDDVIMESVTVAFEENGAGPYFEVEITDHDDEVVEGETVFLEYRVNNIGGDEGRQDIEFVVYDGDGRVIHSDSEEFRITAGNSVTGEFSWTTEAGKTGEFHLEVSSDDHEQEVTVTVLKDAFFEVEIYEYDENVGSGEEVTIKYRLHNTGEVDGVQNIALTVDGTEVATNPDVALEPDENRAYTFTWDTSGHDGGEYDLVVSSDDHEQTITVEVEEDDSPGFAFVLLGIALVFSLKIYRKKDR